MLLALFSLSHQTFHARLPLDLSPSVVLLPVTVLCRPLPLRPFRRSLPFPSPVIHHRFTNPGQKTASAPAAEEKAAFTEKKVGGAKNGGARKVPTNKASKYYPSEDVKLPKKSRKTAKVSLQSFSRKREGGLGVDFDVDRIEECLLILMRAVLLPLDRRSPIFHHPRNRPHPPRRTIPRKASRLPRTARLWSSPRHRTPTHQRCSPPTSLAGLRYRHLDQG